MKHITGKSKTKKQIGPIANQRGELVFNDLQKANVFGIFVSTIGEKLSESFQSGEVGINPAFHRITPSVCDITLSDESFKAKFNAINTRKSHDADNMSSKEMKMVAEEFSPCIANLSRLSYSAGSYPLWKSGNKEDFSNYRPITLLSIPSKIIESVICDNIDKHLTNVLQKNLQILFYYT